MGKRRGVLRGCGWEAAHRERVCDMTVRVWNPSSGEEEAVLKGHEDYVFGVACFVGADGKPRIVSASHDKTVRVWNSSGQEVR